VQFHLRVLLENLDVSLTKHLRHSYVRDTAFPQPCRLPHIDRNIVSRLISSVRFTGGLREVFPLGSGSRARPRMQCPCGIPLEFSD
jgi:hypothetical protein